MKNSHIPDIPNTPNIPETVTVKGTKIWDDKDNKDGKRPDKIKVLLNKTVNGQTTKVAEKEVTKDNWTYEFTDLPKYEGGKAITYSIDEESVDGYTKTVDGYNLKNSYIPSTISTQKLNKDRHSNASDKQKKNSELPNTGEEDHANLIGHGILGILGGVELIIRKKRDDKN